MQGKLSLVLAVALVASGAFADRLTLKSGSFLTGTVKAMTKETIKFESDDLGELEVKLTAVAALETPTEHRVQRLDGAVETLALTVRDGAILASAQPLDLQAVKAIDPEPETWHGAVNVAFQADRGNTHANTASVVANLNRRWDEDRVNFLFGYYYSKTGTSADDWEKTKDRIEVEGQYDHFWLPKFYSYLNGRYERDVIQGLEHRYRLGAGIGYQWLEKEDFELTGKWSFNQELGGAWVNEKYDEPDDDRRENYGSVRYAHHLMYFPKWVEQVEFFHNFEYLPDVSDYSLFLAKADVGFTTILFWNIDLLAKIEWEYNSCPSAGQDKSDYRYLLGLGYKW